MPRQARKKSESGIYHVMFRAVNQQQIFEDGEDFERFIQILTDCKAISGYKLFAYCLMGNHIHLLIQEGKELIEQVMKRIATRFVYWYNIKYQRAGHLFQDRFKSEPVEDDAYFATVVRYIHQNPVKAGLCKKISDYPFSSYKAFFDDSDLIDREFVFEIIPQDVTLVKADYNGYDAIWLQATKGVLGLGHTGLLFEKGDSWYYWYWGISTAAAIVGYLKTLVDCLLADIKLTGSLLLIASTTVLAKVKLEKLTPDQKQTVEKNSEKGWENVGNAYYDEKLFEKAFYIKGEFKKAHAYFSTLKITRNYNLLFNNCMQTTTDGLNMGKYSKKN